MHTKFVDIPREAGRPQFTVVEKIPEKRLTLPQKFLIAACLAAMAWPLFFEKLLDQHLAKPVLACPVAAFAVAGW